MIIGIDGNEANQEQKVGISEYAYQLLLQFKEILNPKSQISNKFQNIKFQIYLKDKPRKDMPTESENWKYVVLGPKKFWTQIGLPFNLFTHFPRPDVFFSPTHYAPRLSPMPTAIAIMDVSYLHFPELFAKKDLYQLRAWTGYSAKKAARIFTISQSSKDDILKQYNKSPEDVVVTYPGIKESVMSDVTKKQLQKKFDISENYILFVGTIQPRKNIERLIEAFAQLKNSSRLRSNNKDLELVIVGKKGWLYEPILAAPEKYNVSDSVKFLEFVSNEDLPALYTHALFFVLPSLYEGFGLPVVEAMKYGCPVITSNVSSLPEAGGDAALYVNPESVEDIAGAMEKLLGNTKLREQLVKKGYEHIKQFSWEKAAEKTLEVLQEVAKG